MCFVVLVGNYVCGHQRWPSHGFPEDFIRECSDHANLHECDLLPNEEDVPWLRPHCHWSYVQQNLAPLWQQTTITKCRILQDAGPTYLQPQRAADELKATFEAQQQAQAIHVSTVAWHKLRDTTLRSYLGENFRSCLMAAHEANRPWSLSYLRDLSHAPCRTSRSTSALARPFLVILSSTLPAQIHQSPKLIL
jgi:hypothetical protein